MLEAVWNGFLRLSLVSCPVRLAPATGGAGSITLDRLNARTGNPVAEQFVDARTGDVVSSDAVVKGYQTASGHVTVTDNELAALAGGPPNIIELAHFAPSDQVDRARLEDSYYIYPDGQLAPDTLEALRLAMQRSGRDAMAYVQLGGRERLVLIQVYGAGLLLSTLRPPRVLEPAEFAERPESAVPGEQVALAQSIIQQRALPADANAMEDRYEGRLRALIEQKSGGPLPPRPAAAPAPVPPPPPRPEPERAVAPPPPEPEPAPAPPPEPEPEPEPEPAAAAEPEPEPEPAVVEPPPPEVEAAEEAAAEAMAAAAVIAAAAPEPEPEPERAVLSGEPEPEPELAAALPPDEEPEAAMAAPPPEPEPAPVGADEAARSRAERSLFGTAATGQTEGREVGTEILLHIMGLGDRRFVEPGWAGNPGSHRQIEAMSIRPREELEPSAVEFRVFAQEGRATAWVSNGNYAGTRGRELPLTGFAVRPAPELRDRFDIVYEGCFFSGGVVGPKRNGEICTSPVSNDPLEAVRVTIVERA